MEKSTIGFFIVFLASILLVQNAEASWFDELTRNLNKNNGYNSWQNNNWQNNNWQQKLQYDIENTKRDFDQQWNTKWKYEVESAGRDFQYRADNAKRDIDNQWNTKWKYEVESAGRDFQYKVDAASRDLQYQAENTKRDLDSQWNNKWKYEVESAGRDFQYEIENTKRELDYQWKRDQQPKIDQIKAEQEYYWRDYDDEASVIISDTVNHSLTDLLADDKERDSLYRNQDVVTESSILLLKLIPVPDGTNNKMSTMDKAFRTVAPKVFPNSRGSDLDKDPVRVTVLGLTKVDYQLNAKVIQAPDGSWISLNDAAEIGYKTSQVKEAKVAFGAMKLAIDANDPKKFESNLYRFTEIVYEINNEKESAKSYELKKSNSPFSPILSPIYNTIDKPSSTYVSFSQRFEEEKQKMYEDNTDDKRDYGSRNTDLVRNTRPATTTVHIVYINAGASSQDCAQNDSCLSQSYLQINGQEKVEWRNADDTAHAISGSGAGKFSSGMLGPGKDYSRKFSNYGQFDYTCMIHPWISGRIVVST